MSGLEQYAIPHNPNSVHQLHWTPGNHGKGVMTQEGVLHHWNVDRADGQPQHRRYIMESPAFGFDPYPLKDWRQELNPFWIKPDGTLSMLNPTSDWQQVAAIDPRLGAPDPSDEWHMGRLAELQNQYRAIDEAGPPKLVTPYPEEVHPDAIARNNYYARRPFIYHGGSNTTYVGAPGEHHNEVYLRHKLDITEPNQYEGYVIKNYPVGENWPDQAAWYNRAPANHEEVLNQVATTFGVPPDHYKPETWHFGANIDERMEDRNTMDPIAFERKYDWDREGDVQHGHPDIEWVPTHELRKFIEYDRRPGGQHSHGNSERWNALGEHLLTEGFKNPVWLDYNPDTGMSHMSEGNHRAQIALDAGIPAVPVRVYRSTRTSPTQISVKIQPQPEWSDQFSEKGYRVPQNMRPSHIGLPTVPPPDQIVSKLAAIEVVEGQTHPSLGVYGEDPEMQWTFRQPAIAHGGRVYVGQPGTHHADVIQEFNLPAEAINRALEIEIPGSSISGYRMVHPAALNALASWAEQKHGKPFAIEPHWTNPSNWEF
jgi:hypothetical protein